MIGSNLACHIVIEPFSPSEISYFDSAALVEEEVEALEVPVKDRRGAGMQVMDSAGSL